MKNIVCVAADHCYDDSMGAYVVAYLWDGEKVTREGGIYQNTDYTSANATIEEKRAASVWLESNIDYSANYNKYAKCDTYVGCIVTLKRSRKAPNNVPVKVIDFIDGGYNSRFNSYESEKVVVETEQGERFTVSYGCIDTLVKGIQKFPYWYVSENEYKQAIEQQQIVNNELKDEADKKERADLIASFVSSLVELDKKGFDVDSNELSSMLNGFSVVDIVTSKDITNDDIKAVLLNIINHLNKGNKTMKYSDIEQILESLPKCEPALKSYKGSTFCFIINECDNVGYDVTLDYNGLRITKFKRDPYKTLDLMSGYESLTIKQVEKIRSHVITTYFPELDYLRG